MLKSLVTWVLMAAALVEAEPIPQTYPEHVDLDTREILERMDLQARDFNLEDQSIEPRTLRNASVLATFEERTASANPKVPLGVYKGLYFNGFALVKVGFGLEGTIPTGVIPFTKTNAVAAPIVPFLGQQSVIQTTYPGSVAASFDLNEFYFGCVLGTVQNLISAPINCKVAIGGYNKAGKRVGFAQFSFIPPDSTLLTVMQKAPLDGTFKNLDKVVLVTTYDSVRQLGVTLFDNIAYSISANITK